MNRVAVPAAIVALAIAGVLVAHAFFNARDDATVDRGAGPGVARPSAAGPRVAPGNVVLLYSSSRLAQPLRRLAAALGGPADSALIAAGQAVIVRHTTTSVPAVRAVTATRSLDGSGPSDPALREFVEFWLGRDP